MNGSVSLRELIDEMEAVMEGCHVFVNRQTGEVFGGTDVNIAWAEANEEEDEDDSPDWQREILDKLREVLDSSDWLEVPGRSGVENYSLMERFCLEKFSGRLRDTLLASISGRGAFGRFKELAERRGVLDDWHAYRRKAIAAELEAWLRANQIKFQS